MARSTRLYWSIMSPDHDDETLQTLDEQFEQVMNLRRQGESQLAEAQFRGLLADYEKGGFTARVAMVHINLAQLIQQQGRLDEAVREYHEAKVLAESIGDKRRVAFALSGLSLISLERGNRTDTESLIEDSLALFREIDDTVGVANQLGNLGLLRQREGRLTEALQLFERAAELFSETDNAQGAIGVLQSVGELHRRQGDYQAAMNAHQTALVVAIQVGNLLAQAHSLRAIGQIYRVQGELGKAERFIQKGMEIHQTIGDVRGVLASLIDLATLSFSRGRSSQAIEQLGRCIEQSRELEMVTPLAKALLNRALYQLDTDRMDPVRADLTDAKKQLEVLQDPAIWNLWYVITARILVRQGQWARAQEIFEQELKRTTSANLAGARPAILGLMAALETAKGNTQKGLELFAESESAYRALGDVDGGRMALLGKARNLAETGSLDESLAALDALWGLVANQPHPQPVLQGEILLGRAGVHHLRESYHRALADVEEALPKFREAHFQLTCLGARVFRAAVVLDGHRFRDEPLPPGLVDSLIGIVQEVEHLDCPSLDVISRLTLADALHATGRASQARPLVSACLRDAERLGFPEGVARSLEVRARIDGDRGTAIEAYRKWISMDCAVRAERLRREWNLPPSEGDESP